MHVARRTAEARGQDDALADLIEADAGVNGVHEPFVGVRAQRLLVVEYPAQSVGFRLGPDIAEQLLQQRSRVEERRKNAAAVVEVVGRVLSSGDALRTAPTRPSNRAVGVAIVLCAVVVVGHGALDVLAGQGDVRMPALLAIDEEQGKMQCLEGRVQLVEPPEAAAPQVDDDVATGRLSILGPDVDAGDLVRRGSVVGARVLHSRIDDGELQLPRVLVAVAHAVAEREEGLVVRVHTLDHATEALEDHGLGVVVERRPSLGLAARVVAGKEDLRKGGLLVGVGQERAHAVVAASADAVGVDTQRAPDAVVDAVRVVGPLDADRRKRKRGVVLAEVAPTLQTHCARSASTFAEL
jgi:hypothetical protein